LDKFNYKVLIGSTTGLQVYWSPIFDS